MSDKVRQVVTTQRLEYFLTHLSLSHTYLLRVQVVNRLNNSHSYTQVSYTHTEVTTSTPINLVAYVVAGLLLFIILLVLAIVVCSVLFVRNVLKSKKTNKYKNTNDLEETSPPDNTTSDKKEYLSLSDVHIGTKMQQTQNYELMTSVYPHHKEHIPLEVIAPPNYCEIPDYHSDSENGTKDTKYENLADAIC